MEGFLQNTLHNGGQYDTQEQDNLLRSQEFLSAKGKINVPLGRTDSGQIIVKDLDLIPHILICGNSGTGKTSFILTILSSICKNYSSDDIKLMIYDSKYVEYLPFRNSSHLFTPIITDRNGAFSEIMNLVNESQDRLNKIAESGCKDAEGYNRMAGFSKLSTILFVIDEFSTLNLSKSEFNQLIEVINKGRITGIHLIVVSSMLGDKNLLKELISVIPCKIIFRLSSKADSRLVLEDVGAELLGVPGEMIFKYRSENHKCKCAYARYENINNVMQAVNKRPASILDFGKLAEKMFDLPISNTQKNDDISDPFGDDLFVEAGLFIIRSKKASIGYLQRVLKIGFNRAARIMDELADNGVVGQEQGTKPRDILMTEEMFNAFVSSKNAGEHKISDGPAVSSQIKSIYSEASVKQKEAPSEPVVHLRDMPAFWIGCEKARIENNEIKYVKPIMTEYGKGTITVCTGGSNIKAIIYKKPTEHQKGFFTFEFKETVNVKSERPSILYIDNNNASEAIKMEYTLHDDPDVFKFLQQISEDIGIPITYV